MDPEIEAKLVLKGTRIVRVFISSSLTDKRMPLILLPLTGMWFKVLRMSSKKCSSSINPTSEERVNRLMFDGGFGICLDNVRSNLVLEFTEQEVWAAIKSFNWNRTPRPDGFIMFSIKKGKIFMKARHFPEFHMKGKLTKSTNSSFISVVPKVENPPSLADFRPISLIG